MKLTKECWFEAAHKLDIDGPCGRLHGHSYRVLCEIEDDVGDDGMVRDFSEVGNAVKCLDHRYLNDLPQFQGKQTTAENIALFLVEMMHVLGIDKGKITVWETRNNAVTTDI